MSVIAAKYFNGYGWCVAKNRDRSYKPSVRLRKSHRNGMERLYIWDSLTKFTEGVNEHGVAIVSASISNEKDEREAAKAVGPKAGNPRRYYSPEGFRIRKALFEVNAEFALNSLIRQEVTGSTLVLDEHECYILEGSYTSDDRYVFEFKRLVPGDTVVRTNHGVLLPWLGYGHDDGELYQSSVSRHQVVTQELVSVKDPNQLLDVLSIISDKQNPQNNPLRIDSRRNFARTTGQLLIIPANRTLAYRPIWCDMKFRFDDLGIKPQKTFFEIVSNQKLVSFKEHTHGL